MTLSPLVPQLRPLEPVKTTFNVRASLNPNGLANATSWFPASVNPVWPGRYEVRYCHFSAQDDGGQTHVVYVPETEFLRWDGKQWTDPLGVVVMCGPEDQWRGVQL